MRDIPPDAIIVKGLTKSFQVRTPVKGVLRNLQRYLFPTHATIEAVSNINLSVKQGERVAFVGPNGAGKSTTIKMLSGIFHPTSGHIRVLGLDPISQRKHLAWRIGVVFGQRSQLWYHLPARMSFRLIAQIYDLPTTIFEKNLDKLIEQFSIERFVDRPVRELSLGERMRCELVANLLHDPEILFLDEPTIGLDVVSKAAIRELILERSKKKGTTLFLTSHDTTDIETVCDRVVMIDRGHIVIDSSVKKLKSHYLRHRIIKLTADSKVSWELQDGLTLRKSENERYSFNVNIERLSCSEAVSSLLLQASVGDLTVEQPPLEELIRRLYLGEESISQ